MIRSAHAGELGRRAIKLEQVGVRFLERDKINAACRPRFESGVFIKLSDDHARRAASGRDHGDARIGVIEKLLPAGGFVGDLRGFRSGPLVATIFFTLLSSIWMT